MTNLLKAPLYAVSEEWEFNGYNDSDFYRVMYNPNTGKLERHETWTTRFGCSGPLVTVSLEFAKKHGLYGTPVSEYDANFRPTGNILGLSVGVPYAPFVMPKDVPAQVWEVAEKALERMAFDALQAETKRRAREVTKGKICRVVSGRKIPKGETVQVLGVPVPDVYGYHKNGFKVLVSSPSKGILKTNTRNLEVLHPEEYEAPEGDLRAKAREIAKGRNFYTFFRTSAVSLV